MILKTLQKRRSSKQKSLAVLIDPDKVESLDEILDIATMASDLGVDFFFVGGSMITNEMFSPVIRALKTSTVPVVIFPGNYSHIDHHADAILFLSLISGRNPEYLIGQHVQAARALKKSTLEVIPTGYMLVGSAQSSVAYVSNTIPIPFGKIDIATNTAIAGELLGQQLIFMDAGSGVKQSATREMIKSVSESISCPLVTGGGIRTPKDLHSKYLAGADLAVVGNVLEEDPAALKELCSVVKEVNSTSHVH